MPLHFPVDPALKLAFVHVSSIVGALRSSHHAADLRLL